MKTIVALAFGLIAFSATAAQAAPEKYTFDPVHTQVMFSVDHIGFSHSHGKFLKFDGGFTFDADKVEASAVNVKIDTASLNMDDGTWEEHLKGENFFNVAKFPAMTFKSTKIEKSGEKEGKLTGELTVLGVTKPVTLDVKWNKSGVHPYSQQYIAGFSASGVIKRSDFGMTYGLPGIGDEVALNIQVEGVRETKTNP
jgi:polyisoprenoid-binding protein YceI